MSISRIATIAALLAFASPALAGTDTWTVNGVARGEMNTSEVAQLTATGTGDSTIIQTSKCSTLDIMTDDTSVTFNVQACTSMAGGCRTRNETVPLDASSKFALGMQTAPAFLRVNVAANPPATFTLTCNP